MFIRFTAWLLGLANAHPPVNRRDFYALKDKICKRYGKLDGYDVQHIVDPCWGYSEEDGCTGPTCRRCGGSGVWSDRGVFLERWRIGGRVFHRPTNAFSSLPACWIHNYIEGRITHPDVSHRSASEAQLWLYLLFDRRLWRRALVASRNCGWQWRPMLALQSLTFQANQVAQRFAIRTCPQCDGRFIRPSKHNGCGWVECRSCERASRFALATATDDDLPF